MFDQQDYYSDEDDSITVSKKHLKESQKPAPTGTMDFSHLTKQGESLLKMMKERGIDLNQNEVKKLQQRRQFKSKDKSPTKAIKPKAGFFDGGSAASIQQLIKALNKALANADPQQASCILSYMLQKKNLSSQDHNKFGIMKCNLLFGLGAYEDCLNKAQELIETPLNKLSAAILSNLISKSRAQLHQILIGFYDLLRAKSLISEHKLSINDQTSQGTAVQKEGSFADSQLDTTIRQINHTEMEYNIKLNDYKNGINLVRPFFSEFKSRTVKQISCGSYHALFLIGKPLDIKGQKKTLTKSEWQTEVFGIGENTVGQILGKPNTTIYKDPVIISVLSGKAIQGVWATMETSLAHDTKGNIYEWGVKQQRNDFIEITYTVNQKIKHLQKGYKHYAALTESGLFYTWGSIQYKQKEIFSKANPHMQDFKNISGFSCGNNNVLVIEQSGEAYALGSNEFGQLGLEGEMFTKQFKTINVNKAMNDLSKVFCFGDCTFLINTEQQVFYCGKYSYERQSQYRIRQAQFPNQLKHVVNMSGNIGNYYLTDYQGSLYQWKVDSSVKFKPNFNQTFTLRTIQTTKALQFRLMSDVQPKLCKVKNLNEQMRTYEPVKYHIYLNDQYGPYGNKLLKQLRCQVFLSTYMATKDELVKQNTSFLESILQDAQKQQHLYEDKQQQIIINEIIEPRLLSVNIMRSPEQASIFDLNMQVQRAGKYFLYIFMEKDLIHSEQIQVEVSNKEKELEGKSKQQRENRLQQRREKAELEKQRLLEDKRKKQQEDQQKKKQTQKRAEQALKKHLKDQQEQRLKIEEERKRRADLQTGGGFDINKLKHKNSNQSNSIVSRGFSRGINRNSSKGGPKSQKSSQRLQMQRTGQSFLPDINARPGSRRKINLPKPSQLITLSRAESKQYETNKQLYNKDTPSTATMSNGFKSQKTKVKIIENMTSMASTNFASITNPISTTTGRGLIKRGVSKGKKN